MVHRAKMNRQNVLESHRFVPFGANLAETDIPALNSEIDIHALESFHKVWPHPSTYNSFEYNPAIPFTAFKDSFLQALTTMVKSY